MPRKLLLLTAITSVCAGLMAGVDTPEFNRRPIELLQSQDSTDWARAAQMIREDRKELGDALLRAAQANDPEPDLVKRWLGPKRMALELLGEIRPDDDRVIRGIAKSLRYEVQPLFGGAEARLDLGARYPAVGALVRIGHPALPHVWHRLEMSDDPLERELCAWIISHVEGGETARLLIERRIAHSDRIKKPRYEHARRLIEKAP